jgi:mono/diheme cytochrome c family protein
MKQMKLLSSVLATGVILFASSCGNKREPGKIYMPDMAYSRAVETYASLDSTIFTSDTAFLGKAIFYNARPVAGTIRIGDMPEYHLPNTDSGYVLSAQVKNPLPPLTGKDSVEAARLYNINCAICHGVDGKASGPLAVTDKVGAIANLTSDVYIKMADGTMYHSIQYGKNNMGSYASQLTRKQRWQMVQYVRTLQPKAAAAPAAAETAAPAVDSVKAK